MLHRFWKALTHQSINTSIDDTLTFPDLLRNAEESDDYKHDSYDVESLFTSIPA